MGIFSKIEDAVRGKKYQNTTSYDYVTPDFSYYAEQLPAVQQQASYAPNVNLDIGGYTPYGKIQDVRDTGQGYTEYDLRKVLDPTISWEGKELSADEDWEKKRRAAIWLGKMEGSNKDPVQLAKQKAFEQGIYSEKENLADEITKGYYTPYELALGKMGSGSDIGFDPSQGFDYSGQIKEVGKRHNQTHYYDQDWAAMRRYDFENEGPLLKASMALSPTLQDTAGWDWEDNTLYDPSYGYFTQDIGDSVYDYNRNNQSESKKWRQGGIPFVAPAINYAISDLQSTARFIKDPSIKTFAKDLTNNAEEFLTSTTTSLLDPFYSDEEARQKAERVTSDAKKVYLDSGLGQVIAIAVPATAPYFYGAKAAYAAGNGRYGDALLSAAGAFIPPGLSPLQQAGVGAAMGGASAGLNGGNIGKGALQGGLTGYIGGSLAGNQYMPQGTAGARYVNPAISKMLTSAAVSGLMGQDAEEAAKNSLTRSAWNTAGNVAMNQFKG